VPDHHRWTLSSSGTYLFKLPYDRFFMGAVQFEPAQSIWRTRAQLRCKLFLWLASLNRCWTVHRLARRDLDHPEHCPLCEQEDETAQHILVACVFSREIWFQVLSLVGLQQCTPGPSDVVFQEWWRAAELMVSKQHGGCGNTTMLVFSKRPPPMPQGSSKTSRMMPGCGA
jgi:hypothetical protein